MVKFYCLIIAALSLAWQPVQANTLWRDIPNNATSATPGYPARFLQIDPSTLVDSLKRAPMEYSGIAAAQISLPMPDGQNLLFSVERSPVLSTELAAQYPDVRTYRVFGIDDPAASGRIGITSNVLHGILFTSWGTVLIDSATSGDDDRYRSYYKRDYAHASRSLASTYSCGVQADRDPDTSPVAEFKWLAKTEGARKNYRIAIAATSEYTAAVGAGNATTALNGANGIVAAINRVNAIYNRDLNIHLMLVSDTSVVYTDPDTDPYTNDNGFAMLDENQTNLDAVIGNGAYDIGHVFSTGGGGVATIGVVCEEGFKARGVTGLSSPVGDAFWIDFVAHEIGHQFRANHTFNGTEVSCAPPNRNSTTAYEPGSGSTIMAYAGICGSENIQNNSDATFHSGSIAEINAFITAGGGNCNSVTTNANTAPTVSAGNDFTIPRSTPFQLTGSASDAGTDDLIYQWDQLDAGAATSAGTLGTDLGSNALMRSYPPVCDNSRIFPALDDLLANTTTLGETLPTSNRKLNFRLTVRDLVGGVNEDDTQITVDASVGPFAVTHPNSVVVWDTTTPQTVTWNVSGTTAGLVNCANVDIALSINGGATFPTTLLAATPNDGNASVTLPSQATANARVKIQCSDNIFFDVSDTDFGLSTPANPGPIGNLPTIAPPAEPACAIFKGSGSSSGGSNSSNSSSSGSSPIALISLLLLLGIAVIRMPRSVQR